MINVLCNYGKIIPKDLLYTVIGIVYIKFNFNFKFNFQIISIDIIWGFYTIFN